MAAARGPFTAVTGGPGAVLARALPSPRVLHGASPRLAPVRPDVAHGPGAPARATPAVPVVLDPVAGPTLATRSGARTATGAPGADDVRLVRPLAGPLARALAYSLRGIRDPAPP